MQNNLGDVIVLDTGAGVALDATQSAINAEKARAEADRAKAEADRAEAEARDVNVFVPAVDTEGVLSWSNKKGLPNPQAVNIRGPQGVEGKQGKQGIQGVAGTDSTITIGKVVDGDIAGVTNVGTPSNAVLDFVLPRGKQGERGLQGLAGKDGQSATIAVGNVVSGDVVSVTNSGTALNAVLDFTLPRGEQGKQGERGLAGSDGVTFTPAVSESGDLTWSNNGNLANPALVNLKGPQGLRGLAGADGKSATVSIGQVISGDVASVTNVGDNLNAIFNFTLQRGEQGIQGPAGPRGERGAGIGVKGSYPSLHDLQTAHPSGVEGEAYLVGGSLIVWDGKQWLDCGNIQGPAGADGKAGRDGAVFTPAVSAEGVLSWSNNGGLVDPQAINIKGPRGLQGERGLDGKAGVDGQSATVSIGKVTEGTTAGVTNSGTTLNAILDFVLPRGQQGIAGPAGKDGPAGRDGVSVTHSWSGSTLSVTSASGTTSADLRGPAGPAGVMPRDEDVESLNADYITLSQPVTYATTAGGNVIVNCQNIRPSAGKSLMATLIVRASVDASLTLQNAGDTYHSGSATDLAIKAPMTTLNLLLINDGVGVKSVAQATPMIK